MAYTALQLITNAYYLSNVVSRDSQTVSGGQAIDGLEMLNFIINDKAITYKSIPYFNSVVVTASPGVEKYFVPKLLEIESMTFDIGAVRYPMYRMDRNSYFSSARANNINSLPYAYHFERAVEGSNIFLYFLPNSAYPITIWGKFSFDDMSLEDDMTQWFDLYYINYLRYCLAQYICSIYPNVEFPPQAYAILKSIEQRLSDPSPVDYTMKKYSSFTICDAANFGMANLWNGYYPI